MTQIGAAFFHIGRAVGYFLHNFERGRRCLHRADYRAPFRWEDWPK